MVTAMKTAVLDSGFAGSSRQTIPLVLEPARRTRRAVTREARAGESKPARIPKRVVVPFSVPSELEAPDARIRVPKSGVLGWVELGFVMVLFASAFVLIFLSVAAAGNM
jgi:hypothetical protein